MKLTNYLRMCWELSNELFNRSIVNALIEINEQQKLDGNEFNRDLFINTKINLRSKNLPYEQALDINEEIGEKLFEDISGELKDIRKRILLNLVMFIEPEWMSFSNYKGRDQIRNNIEEVENSDNIFQSFNDAELFNDNDYEVDIWWAIVQSKAYSENLTDVISGIIGENLSMEYERKRLKDEGLEEQGFQPTKISTKNSTVGYDIESWESVNGEDIKKIFIEVKYTQREYVRFFLSRNEYNAAEKYRNDYRVHVWQKNMVDKNDLKPTKVFSYTWLEANVPQDRGEYTYWNKVLIDEGIKQRERIDKKYEL